MNYIEVTNLTKRYGNFTAVNDISFHVRKGEIVGFLGVNGAGKTTTLRLITGIIKQTEGSISICGNDSSLDPEICKGITGYIPDRPYLYPKLTAFEFLHFVADLYNVDGGNVYSLIQNLLSEFGLSRWQNDLIESFSHGMKQRLSTCSALIHTPKVLIIDEPMVGLDPHGARLFKEKLKQLASSGMAILLSTHSLHVAQELSDRLIIIDHGTILTEGTFEEIQQKSGINEQNLEQLFIQLTDVSGEYQFL